MFKYRDDISNSTTGPMLIQIAFWLHVPAQGNKHLGTYGANGKKWNMRCSMHAIRESSHILWGFKWQYWDITAHLLTFLGNAVHQKSLAARTECCIGRGSSARSSSRIRGHSAVAAAPAPGRFPGRLTPAAAAALGCARFSPGSSATSWNGEAGNFGRSAAAAIAVDDLQPIFCEVSPAFSRCLSCSLQRHAAHRNPIVSRGIDPVVRIGLVTIRD